MLKHLWTSAAFALLACGATAAHAQSINFDTLDLNNWEWPKVDSFYDGGSTAGHWGPHYGVTFQPDAWLVFSGMAENPSIFVIVLKDAAWISASNGFSDKFSFRFGTYGNATLSIYSGMDGTGSLLAERTFGQNLSNSSSASTWSSASIDFAGLAHSVVIRSNPNEGFGIDDITFGAVPEPASWAMMIGGLGLMGTALRRRRAIAVRYAV